MKSYIVIGLGRFGSTVAAHLCELGNEVLAMDMRQESVQRISAEVTTAVAGDARDIEVLRSIGASNFDCAIVAMGSDLASGVLITLNLKELGVRNVICKARDDMQKRALEKIGADSVLIPEREIGIKLAQRLNSTSVLDFIELSPEYGIAEVLTPDSWIGKTIAQLDIRAKYGVNIIAVKSGNDVVVSPGAAYTVCKHDIIVVVGRDTDLAAIKSK